MAAKAGYKVIGIDSNEEKVTNLNNGISPIEDLSQIDLKNVISGSSYRASSNYLDLIDCNIIIICVPTPLAHDNASDLSFLENAVKKMCRYLQKGTLIILESTVATGTTRNFLAPMIEVLTNNSIEEYNLAYSPERVDPRNLIWNSKNTPKLVSGLTSESLSKTIDFYSSLIDNVVSCTSLEIAETAKLLENSFRLVNISLINEISNYCRVLEVDINEVIKVASTKPYGFMPFHPSIGVGGHCIPVDPIYLIEHASKLGVQMQMIETAAMINRLRPDYFIDISKNILGDLKNKKIIIIGVAYKPNISDTRETPVKSLIEGLRAQGAIVYWHDDLVSQWNSEKSVALGENYDLAILATPHDYIDLSKLGNVPTLDTHGSL